MTGSAPADAAPWLVASELLAPDARSSPEDLAHVRGVREGLRAMVVHNAADRRRSGALAPLRGVADARRRAPNSATTAGCGWRGGGLGAGPAARAAADRLATRSATAPGRTSRPARTTTASGRSTTAPATTAAPGAKWPRAETSSRTANSAPASAADALRQVERCQTRAAASAPEAVERPVQRDRRDQAAAAPA